MNEPIKGSCLCEGVKYSIHGAIKNALYCHCPMCRKVTGASCRPRAEVATQDLVWNSGEDKISYYNSSHGQHRAFCSVCGSTLITKFDEFPEVIAITLGTLDDDPGIRPEMHVYVAEKAPWYEITDNLKQHETIPSDE
jgi:hypothetical protein